MKDFIKIKNDFYVLETLKRENKVIFKILKQLFSKKENIKEIEFKSNSQSEEELHKELIGEFCEGLRINEEDPYKAAEFLSAKIEKEKKEITQSDSITYTPIKNKYIDNICNSLYSNLIAFFIFKPKQFYECKKEEDININEITHLIYQFIESNKHNIKTF